MASAPSAVADIDRLPAVLGEERLLEARLPAREVDELVLRGRSDDRTDRPGHPHPQDVVLGDEVADALETGEDLERDGPGEPELDLVVRQVAQRVDRVDAGQPAVADDPDPVARPLDLVDDVAGEERRPALVARLAEELEEVLLDERVEARCRLVEDEQLGPMLERDDEADLLLVALRVLAELAGRIEIEAARSGAAGRPARRPPRRFAKYSIVWAPVSRSYRPNSPGR